MNVENLVDEKIIKNSSSWIINEQKTNKKDHGADPIFGASDIV